ncbi:MAG: amidohydrolase family protein, partial [Thaumarchaeota archaeon]|nr:amidohydrolase family protein [Nitrososphaerota archaeon]
EAVVRASTATPASAIGAKGSIGTLKPGAFADIVCFKVVEGKYPLLDVRGKKQIADKMIAVTDVVKSGKIVSRPA